MESVSILNEEFEDKLLKLAAEIDRFEGYAHPHAARIAVLADAVAQHFNLASHDRFSLSQAALVHDIGEMVMQREYFRSNRMLNVQERVDMQRHPVIGEQEAAKRGLSRAVQLLVRWHHEWWNGTGYPDALEMEDIPLAARILRVADTYASVTDDRPYKKAMSKEEAGKYLTEWAGIEFDPKVVKVFLALEGLQELESFAVSEKYPPREQSATTPQYAPVNLEAPETEKEEIIEQTPFEENAGTIAPVQSAPAAAAETTEETAAAVETKQETEKKTGTDAAYTSFWDNYK